MLFRVGTDYRILKYMKQGSFKLQKEKKAAVVHFNEVGIASDLGFSPSDEPRVRESLERLEDHGKVHEVSFRAWALGRKQETSRGLDRPGLSN
jgi:hypothetical protein